VEVLRRYSKLDSFQNVVQILRKHEIINDDGSLRVSSPRSRTTPPEPFKLDQRLKPQAVAELVARYEAGEPSTALATLFGISKGSVLRLLRDADVPIRKQRLSDDQITEAARLYASGLSLGKIGQMFGVDSTTVWRRLLGRGVTMRDSHGRNR
jgi:DNA invertase Pin-like site-specific DNA recombinase